MEKLTFSGLGQWILEELGVLQKSMVKDAKINAHAKEIRDRLEAGEPMESVLSGSQGSRHIVRDPNIGKQPVQMMSPQERAARQKTAAEEAKIASQYTGEIGVPEDVKGLRFGTERMITDRRSDTQDPTRMTQEPSFSRHAILVDGQKVGSADVDHQHQITGVDTKHKHTNAAVMAALTNKNNTPEERARWEADQNLLKEHAADILRRSKAGQREPNLSINIDSEHLQGMTPERVKEITQHVHRELYAHLKSKAFKQAVGAHTEEANNAAKQAHAEELKAKEKVSNLSQQDNVGAAAEQTQAKQAAQAASTANIAPGTGGVTPQKSALEWLAEKGNTSPTAPMGGAGPSEKKKRGRPRIKTGRLTPVEVERNAAAKAKREVADKQLATATTQAATAGESIEDGRAKFHKTLQALKDLHQTYVEAGSSPHNIKAIQEHIDEHMKDWNKYNPDTTAEPTLPKPPEEPAASNPSMFTMDLADTPEPKAKDTTAPIYFDPSKPEKV